jgi:hypothetical protein
MIAMRHRIKAAFGCYLLAFFRHNAAGIRLMTQRNGQHFFGRRHFKIKRQANAAGQSANIAIANMAAVFAQMRRNAIRTGARGNLSGAHRVRQTATSRIPNGGHMVDINAQS